MRKWLFPIALLAACSYTFDEDAPEIPLVGNPPDMSKFPRMNNGPVLRQHYIIGADNHYWWMMEEAPRTLHSVRLPDGDQEEILKVPDDLDYDVWGSSVFFTNRTDEKSADPVMLKVHVLAKPDDDVYTLPPGPGLIGAAYYERIFYYWPMRADAKTFLVVHRDGSVTREIPIPEGIDPKSPPSLSFNYYGTLLVMRDPMDHVTSYSTVKDEQHDLGVLPPGVAFDYDDRTLISVGKDGIHRVPTDGTPAITLDPRAASDGGWLFYRNKDNVDEVWYRVLDDGGLWAVRRDGKGEPHLIMAGGGFERILAFAPPDYDQIVYTKDPSSRYIYGAGDGWLGDWRFMERGFGPMFTEEGKRIYWLEHAAQSSGSGDLLTATVPGGAPERLARAVYEMSSLDDGRVLALANRQSIGTWNRLIVIDQQAKTASWVATAVRNYHFIPGTEKELFVDIITGATGYDVLRVPVPPRADNGSDGGTP